MNIGFLWILLSFFLYGIIHSYMASISFKTFLERRYHLVYFRFYRFFYNVFSFLTFLPIFALTIALPNATLYRILPPWSTLMRATQLGAFILFLISLLQTNAWSFLGFSQLSKTTPVSDVNQLVTRGFYRFVRHPLYLFALIFIWLNPGMSWNVLGFNLGATLYLLVGIYFEERKLLREFGEEYKQYQTSVPMLLPFLKMKL